MNEAPPALFDAKATRRNRARALKGDSPAFLREAVEAEILWRLDLVLRQFPKLLLVGAAPGDLATRIAQTGKAGEVIPAEIVAHGNALVIDPESLPFAPESLDAVIWAGGLESVNDLPGTLIQIRRALKADGLFLGCVLAGESLKELRQSFLAAESELSRGASPRIAPFAEVRAWGALLQRAGFALPVADLDRLDVNYGNALTLMQDLKAMGLANPLMARRKTFTPPSLLARAAAHYAGNFANEKGRLKATFELVTLTGWAPHESQQKPLKPGSAKFSLAEALGTKELKP
ncbi:MAG: class I SAM-dependent methyltransferase [Aestuariivirgaceae bacterium]|nr:class I SAM-dependent methyltransferase [Aestuariivirgaceae bacterium]